MERNSRCLKMFICVLSFLFFAVIFISCSKSGKGEAAIIVNGQKISKKEFNSLLDREVSGLKAQFKQFGREFDAESEEGKNFISNVKKRLSEDMVQRLLILDAAEKENIKIEDAEVEEQLKNIKERFGEEGFNEFKKKLDVDEGYVKKDIAKQMLIAKYVDILFKDVKVEESEVEAYFNANSEKFDQPEMVRANHILLKTEEEAQDIIKRVKKGEDFSELAFNLSIDPSAKQNRGDLNYFPRGVMDKAFEDAAFSMSPGEISKPVKTKFGYHIIKFAEKKPPEKGTIENSRDAIVSSLSEEKRKSIIETKIAELRRKAKIEINVDTEGDKNDKGRVEKK